jgi:hypothetical protein
MSKRVHDDDVADDPVSVGERVRVYPGTDAEKAGVVVDDFGETGGSGVQIGDKQIAGPARRWAILLDAGELVFVDSSDVITG